MMAILLAAALALPPGAEAVRIGEDAWPERIAEAKSGERVWWWSNDCAPQLLTPDAPGIECTPPVVRRVQVVDRASGKELPGARVVWGTDAMRVDLPDAMLPFTVTGTDGEALLRVPHRTNVSIRVDGPRAASWWQSVTPGIAPVRLAAVPAAPAALQVTIGGSEPATRAIVQIEWNDARGWATARDGRITLPVVPPVPVLVVAWSEASAPMVGELDAAQLPRTIDLPRGTTVSGRIVDARRRPIEGAAIEAVVAIGKLPRGLRRHARSSGAGTFVVRGIPAGSTQLKFKKAGRATVVRAIEADGGGADAGDVVLRASRQIALRVFDRDRQPVAGATVRVTDGPSGVTARDGMARIDGVTVEEDAAVHVTAKGFRATDLDVAANARFPLDVELSRGVRVVGRVVHATSGANAGPGDVLVLNNGAQRVIAFDESGAIDVGGLDAGTLALEIRAHALAPLAIGTRTVTTDERWDLGTLQMAEGTLLAGRVVDRDRDEPVPGARIRVLRRGETGAALAAVMNDWIAATADDDGSFTVSGLAAGPHVVMFDASGFAPRVITIIADRDADHDADSTRVELDRARSLSIDCAPVRRCGSEARLLYAGAAYPWASTSATIQDGKAHLVTTAPGTALLRLVDKGEVVHEREVQIEATPDTEIRIRLGTATLRGTVASAGRPRRDGGSVELRGRTTPAAGPAIYVENRTPDGQVLGGSWQTDLPSFESAPVDDAGQFLFAELEPGQYEATYRRGGRTSNATSVVIQAGSSQIVLDVAPGELRGRVLHEDGRPAAFAPVHIVDAAGTRSLAQSDQFGNFATLGITPGRAAVTAEDAHTEAAAEVDVDALRTAVVELVMRAKTVAAAR
jgi:Carboxypeptidase regulatory-like domain